MLSVALYVDHLEGVAPSLSAERPGLLFRPPEFPGILIEPSTPAPLTAGALTTFAHGKSCLLPWSDATGAVALRAAQYQRRYVASGAQRRQ